MTCFTSRASPSLSFSLTGSYSDSGTSFVGWSTDGGGSIVTRSGATLVDRAPVPTLLWALFLYPWPLLGAKSVLSGVLWETSPAVETGHQTCHGPMVIVVAAVVQASEQPHVHIVFAAFTLRACISLASQDAWLSLHLFWESASTNNLASGPE